jgi:diguanylate cyclase (GGDEF)-like protein
MAHHDPLTELPNRALLRERVQRAIGRARRGGRGFALHFLDLDRFKSVNDALGHFVGDQLLQAVSRRLVEVAGEGNTVARLGGDEFAILQTNVSDRSDAGDLAERVLASLSGPFTCDGQQVSSGASIGITLHPGDGNTVEELLRNADIATYRAKADGRNAYTFYVRDMNVRARAAISLESDLRLALLREEFVVHFQPQISLRTGRVIGAEALLRWKREGGVLMKPGEFLPLAEETGLIVPINDWVLREACTRAVQWGRAGMPRLRCAVNLSPMQFRKQDVLRTVMGVLEDTGLDPDQLELELTESILMENPDAAARTLRDLRGEGVQFSIDDFGTGYSSLSYVKNFPVGRLKIDQSFIRNLKTDPSDTAIVRAIINLAHSLKLEVVAEGVETPEQFTQLIAEGCDEMQGYYFSPPLQDEDFRALVQHGHVLPQPA